MNVSNKSGVFRGIRLVCAALMGILIFFAVIAFARFSSTRVHAAPIDPPDGYPKFNTSTMVVSPTLAHTGGETLQYLIEIRNTGAYMAEGVLLTDTIPANTTYNDDAWASSGIFTYTHGVLLWEGDVGFDSKVMIGFSVTVSPDYEGLVHNSAVIEQALIKNPVTISAETMVTELPILRIEKTSTPEVPGPDKLLTYEIKVTNQGQLAQDLPLVVTDVVPLNTQLIDPEPGGPQSPAGDVVTWEREVTLDTGETSEFTFTVRVDDVPSGTVVANTDYRVYNPQSGVAVGEPNTVTVIDPILYIHKSVQPYPPGSNSVMTYTLTVLNKGSLATELVIEDHVPDGVDYVSGGSFSGGVVSWDLAQLNTDESAQFFFSASVGDVADVEVINDNYSVCAEGEGVCQYGSPLLSLIQGPTFEVTAMVDPIAKKPGGGSSDKTTVTPTLVIRNLGPGSALDAVAQLYFERISVSFTDLKADPDDGTFYDGPDCGEKCDSYIWIGHLANGEAITLTTIGGQSTIGGEEGTHYTATVVVTDTLGAFTSEPITATAIGTVTHYANLIPFKTAPPVIGAGQVLTYSILVHNSGLSTEVPPYPVLTETIPLSTTLIRESVSYGGFVNDLGTAISWTLPAMSTGDQIEHWFAVLVDPDLVSGTEIINSQYGTAWTELVSDTAVVFSNTGKPVSTIVKEVGLIDSFKTVTPTMVRPGSGNVLTYTVNVVNSGPSFLNNVTVYDLFPWEYSTYQRDAVASSGQIISDIVSLAWTGNVGPFSSEAITFSVVVDDDYQGPITNTAYIDHASLRSQVIVHAVAYATDQPVLRIRKTAHPDPVPGGEEMLYTIIVSNLGQEATSLVVTDVIPNNTQYVPGSASDGGSLTGDQLRWEHLLLGPGEKHSFIFRVKAPNSGKVTNDQYQVTCAEGVTAIGDPVITLVTYTAGGVYLPIIMR